MLVLFLFNLFKDTKTMVLDVSHLKATSNRCYYSKQHTVEAGVLFKEVRCTLHQSWD